MQPKKSIPVTIACTPGYTLKDNSCLENYPNDYTKIGYICEEKCKEGYTDNNDGSCTGYDIQDSHVKDPNYNCSFGYVLINKECVEF